MVKAFAGSAGSAGSALIELGKRREDGTEAPRDKCLGVGGGRFGIMGDARGTVVRGLNGEGSR